MAHLSLGVCYTHGKGVEESMLKAFEHHTEASKSGIYIVDLYIISLSCRYSCTGVSHKFQVTPLLSTTWEDTTLLVKEWSRALRKHLRVSNKQRTLDLHQLRYALYIVQAALSKLPLYTVPVQRLYALDPYMTAFLLFCLIYIYMHVQVNLGNMYYNGLGVTKDKAKAKELYKLAADRDKNAKALLEEIEAEEKKEGGNS